MITRTVLLATLVCLGLALSTVRSADGDAGDKVALRGYVLTIEDDNGTVKSVKLVVAGQDEDVTYQVTLDEKGKKLAALDGKDVKATGVVTTKDNAKWLAVESFKEVKDEEE